VTRFKEYEASEGITNAKDAEEKARDEVLFSDEPPLDGEEITDTVVRWVDDMDVTHVDGCYGTHCRHFDCDISDTAIDYREYCSQCDVDAY
jgi:hypothetical protein